MTHASRAAFARALFCIVFFCIAFRRAEFIMGADGGTIPKRQELIHKRKRPAKLNKKEQSADKWRNCQLSHQPLQKPIIACRSGRYVIQKYLCYFCFYFYFTGSTTKRQFWRVSSTKRSRRTRLRNISRSEAISRSFVSPIIRITKATDR